VMWIILLVMVLYVCGLCYNVNIVQETAASWFTVQY